MRRAGLYIGTIACVLTGGAWASGAWGDGRLANQRGCLSCHSTDGSSGVGPTWKGLAGSAVRLANGSTVTADGEYLTQIADLVAYIRSLG